MLNKLLLIALLVLGPAGALPDNVTTLYDSGGGGGGTDYTADADFYELWDFNDTGSSVCDGTVNGNDLSEDGTIVHVTSGGGLVEGAAAADNNNGGNGCSGSLTSAPTGSWTFGIRFYPTESGIGFNQYLFSTNDLNNFGLRANTSTAADWRIASSNIANQHTVAVDTQYSIIVAYDGTDLTFWWDGGSGGDCSGSTYTSTLDPSDITSIDVSHANPWGGIVDEMWLAGDVFTQTDACNVHDDGIDGAGLP